MQSIFRLPWCSEQLNMSERTTLNKMRPAPMVEIPMLNPLKRKFSACPDMPSPHCAPLQVKKQRPEVELPQQLPTPSSPMVNDARTFPNPEPLQHIQTVSPATDPSTGTSALPDSPAQATAGAEQIRPSSASEQVAAEKSRADSGSGGYFSAKPAQDGTSGMAPASATQQDPITGLTPLQQVIENTFNMQILMKHNELRLIEQELAKCQIALEQLRRCELRPFPGSSGLDLSVTEGTGPAVEPPPGWSRAPYAAPYGVTDGPYTRHYRQWLIPDPMFDPLSPQALAQAEHHANSSRSARNLGNGRRSASKSLATTTRAADSLQSIPNYPAPVTKDKNTPQILRRSTDNKLVKLVCPIDDRYNFSSIQGFLNHCRIAHKLDYKSHDAAAIACGQVLTEAELANLSAETQAIPAAKPTPSRRNDSVSTAMTKNASHLVHPLNTPTATPVNTPGPRPSRQLNPLAVPLPKLNIKTPQTQQSAIFTPAASLPRLSAHFAKHQLSGDLANALASAQQKVDLSFDDDLMSPATPDVTSPRNQTVTGKRMPLAGAGAMRPGTLPSSATQRPESRKGFRQPTQQRPRPPPLAPAPSRDHSFNMTQSTVSSPNESSSAFLSPNVADSNPGLVSDHEDDDHGSGSDDENSSILVAPARHPLHPAGQTCGDPMELDVQEDDDMDQHGVIIRRNSMSAEDARGLRGVASPSRKAGGK